MNYLFHGTKTGRFLKYAGLCFLSIVLLCSITAVILLHTLLSPAHITPLALEQARIYLQADTRCEKVELTLFSSFPQVGVHLTNGSVVTLPTDTLQPNRQDSLISFGHCTVTINPLSYLISNTINIGCVLVEDADIYAYTDKQGRHNWDLFPVDTVATDSTENEDFTPRLKLQQIEIRNSNVIFDDRNMNIYGRLEGIDTRMTGYFSERENDLNLWMKTRELLYWQQGKLITSKLAVEVHTRLFHDRVKGYNRLEDTELTVNGITIHGKGEIQEQRALEAMDMNLDFGLDIPSLTDLFRLIPSSLIREAADVEAQGVVSMKGSVTGRYGHDQWPVLQLGARITDGKASYKGMKQRIDSLNLAFDARIDYGCDSLSYINLEEFCFSGASSHLDITGSITNPIHDPHVKASLDAALNFTELAQIFPVADSIQLAGEINGKMEGGFRVADVMLQNWGKVDLEGDMRFSKVNLFSMRDSFEFRIPEARIRFGSNVRNKELSASRLLAAELELDQLRFRNDSSRLRVNGVKWEIQTMPAKDLNGIFPVKSTLSLNSLRGGYRDTLRVKSGSAKISVQLKPQQKQKYLPQFESTFKFDSLFARAGDRMLALELAGFSIKGSKQDTVSDYWSTEGVIGVRNMRFFTPVFPMLVEFPGTKFTVGDDRITLDHARIKTGDSEINLSGTLFNLTQAFLHGGVLRGNLELRSENIDCNQLLKAVEEGEQAALPAHFEDEQGFNEIATLDLDALPVNDSIPPTLFEVPANLELTLQTDIRNVHFAKLLIENIKGEINLRDQGIELNDIQMQTLAADMNTTLLYQTREKGKAYTGFDIDMQDILVGQLTNLIPALDTLVPMLGSLDGRVNFRMAAEMTLDSAMNVVIPSIRAASKLKGDSLVLLDGETFAEISRMLHFKNKKRNLIDSMSVELTIQEGIIEIYPFIVNFDRYQAAVGGQHNLDMSFNYHISILKSPIPFTLGLNVTGTPDDFKYKLAKPKYKDLKKSVRKSPVDSTGVELRKKLFRMKGLVEQEGVLPSLPDELLIRDDTVPRS